MDPGAVDTTALGRHLGVVEREGRARTDQDRGEVMHEDAVRRFQRDVDVARGWALRGMVEGGHVMATTNSSRRVAQEVLGAAKLNT